VTGVQERKTSFCRACSNNCPVLLDIVDAELVKVKGDPANPVWHGYTCAKGRAQPAFYRDPSAC
jgi:anaerobic selenocysteine-containing dehydrogenase